MRDSRNLHIGRRAFGTFVAVVAFVAGMSACSEGAGQRAFDTDTFEAITDSIGPGAHVVAAKGELPSRDPAFTQGLEIWKSLFVEGIMREGAIGLQQYPDANNEFMSGSYAMIVTGSWFAQCAVRASMIPAMEAVGVSNPEPFTIAPIDFPDVAGTGSYGGPSHATEFLGTYEKVIATGVVLPLISSWSSYLLPMLVLNDPGRPVVTLLHSFCRQPVHERPDGGPRSSRHHGRARRHRLPVRPEALRRGTAAGALK